jgi:TatD DNase family protein
MLVDIHTHHLEHNAKHYTVLNAPNLNFSSWGDRPVSLGLHPWYLVAETWQFELSTLKESLHDSRVVAIGECGLDKLCTTPWDLQMMAFQAQLELAEETGKPLILHVVRSHNEVLNMLRKRHFSFPFLFHGFAQHPQWAKSIVQAGGYLSVGPRILKNSYKEIIKSIPLDRLFLETDNSPFSLEELYDAVSMMLKCKASELEEQLARNAERFLNIKLW